ncbi:hypothetical protein [Escherichia coli]|uniref:hypothetical protein n=1 Tax=Escherichia coli TaxID=562 RepID=UPI00057817FA|nr:hypothetical protein [Escherichia coli]
MKKLLTAFGLLCLCGSAAAQTVVTATPADNGYKFVWSGDSAVMKIKDGANVITVRCNFVQDHTGVDDDAKPYQSSIFNCGNGGIIALKRVKGSKVTMLIASDENGNMMTQDRVSVTTKTY